MLHRAPLPLLVLASLVLSACPEPSPVDKPDDSTDDDADAGPGDAGSEGEPDGGGAPDDAGTAPPTDAGPGPDVAAVMRTGAYTAGHVSDLLTSATSSLVIAGTIGNVVDPLWFDLPGTDPVVAAGLVVHDQATGATRILGDADGWPTFTYFDGPHGVATAPVADLEWLTEGESFAAASFSHVVRGAIADDGTFSFASTTVRAPDLAVDATVTSLVHAGGELFVGTDQGLAVLDPNTLEVVRFVDLTLGPLPWVWGLAAGDLQGDVVAVLASAPDSFATHVVLVHPGDTTGSALAFPAGTTPSAVVAMQGSFLVGGASTTEGGSLHLLTETRDGPLLEPWALPEELVGGAGEPVVPNSLAYDATASRLLVGGQIFAGSLVGGGLLAVPADPDAVRTGAAFDLIERRDPYRQLVPPFVDVLHVDEGGRVYTAGRELCSESRLGRVGLVRIEPNDREVRLARPWVTGVRDIVDDPLSDTTWLGLRDEIPGLRCEGINVDQGVCQLREDGSCEVFTPFVTDELRRYPSSPGPSAIAFGDPLRQEMAIATRRDETYVRVGDTARSVATQISPSLNLHTTSAAFGDSGLWIGSEMHWETFSDPELDEEAINARGPHGLGYLEFDDRGATVTARRYVRSKPADSLSPDEIEGLPSNWVWDVLPLPGHRRALVATGVERRDRAYDHLLPAPSGQGVDGGIAVIDDAQVARITPPTGFHFVDVTALATDAAGAHFALDSASGVVQLDLESRRATLVLATSFPEGERGTALALLADGAIAIGTNRGLRLYSPTGGLTVVDVPGGTGVVWDLEVMADGLLAAGTDQGLVFVAIDGGALPTVLGPAGPLPRDWAPLDWGCFGDVTCPCDPGVGAECGPGLVCEPVGGALLCQEQAGCGGAVGCECSAEVRCAPGLVCNANNICEEQAPDACALDCSCDTLSGCPDGQTCQGGIAGFSCGT